MKTQHYLFFAIFYSLIIGCHSSDETLAESKSVNPRLPETNFTVFSDPHFLSDNLYDSGSAFKEHMLWKKGNLTEKSDYILNAFINTQSNTNSDFILVTGDLTNNGEMLSHIDFISYLQKLEKQGNKVFVVPGNHDVLFPWTQSFMGSRSFSVENISPEKYLTLYQDFGYSEAISRDMYSLSYSAEVKEDLILIGLDSCQYGNSEGYINHLTLEWLESQLSLASIQEKSVILFMHHSLLEHFEGQEKDKDMLLENREILKELLHQYKVSLVFSGHYHAMDIAMDRVEGHTLYDIQTSSLISWPLSYRTISVNDERTHIQTHKLEVPEIGDQGRILSKERIVNYTEAFLDSYNVSSHDSELISEYMSETLLIHYKGDEPAIFPYKIEGLSLWGKMALLVGKKFYEGRQTDLPPSDNNIIINNITGEWEDDKGESIND